MNRRRNNGKIKLFGRFSVSKTFLGISTIVLLVIIYVVSVSIVSNKGVEVSQLESQKNQLEGQNERLSVEAARLQSLEVIDQNASGEIEIGDNVDGSDNQNGESGSENSENQEVTLQNDNPPEFVQTSEVEYLPTDGFVASR